MIGTRFVKSGHTWKKTVYSDNVNMLDDYYYSVVDASISKSVDLPFHIEIDGYNIDSIEVNKITGKKITVESGSNETRKQLIEYVNDVPLIDPNKKIIYMKKTGASVGYSEDNDIADDVHYSIDKDKQVITLSFAIDSLSIIIVNSLDITFVFKNDDGEVINASTTLVLSKSVIAYPCNGNVIGVTDQEKPGLYSNGIDASKKLFLDVASFPSANLEVSVLSAVGFCLLVETYGGRFASSDIIQHIALSYQKDGKYYSYVPYFKIAQDDTIIHIKSIAGDIDYEDIVLENISVYVLKFAIKSKGAVFSLDDKCWIYIKSTTDIVSYPEYFYEAVLDPIADNISINNLSMFLDRFWSHYENMMDALDQNYQAFLLWLIVTMRPFYIIGGGAGILAFLTLLFGPVVAELIVYLAFEIFSFTYRIFRFRAQYVGYVYANAIAGTKGISSKIYSNVGTELAQKTLTWHRTINGASFRMRWTEFVFNLGELPISWTPTEDITLLPTINFSYSDVYETSKLMDKDNDDIKDIKDIPDNMVNGINTMVLIASRAIIGQLFAKTYGWGTVSFDETNSYEFGLSSIPQRYMGAVNMFFVESSDERRDIKGLLVDRDKNYFAKEMVELFLDGNKTWDKDSVNGFYRYVMEKVEESCPETMMSAYRSFSGEYLIRPNTENKSYPIDEFKEKLLADNYSLFDIAYRRCLLFNKDKELKCVSNTPSVEAINDPFSKFTKTSVPRKKDDSVNASYVLDDSGALIINI